LFVEIQTAYGTMPDFAGVYRGESKGERTQSTTFGQQVLQH
jgi:hypothetical protein